MPQVLLNIPTGLQNRITPLARLTNENTAQLAIRLLQEYVDDCEEADRISAEIDAGIMPTRSV